MHKTFYVLLLVVAVIFMAISCDQQDPRLEPVPDGVQAISLLGDTLNTPELSEDIFQMHNEGFLTALAEYRENPDSTDAIIWLGRRSAYLGEYREAVEIFTEGIQKDPDDPRLYRHRGHRYITLRRFDLAMLDFEKAAELMEDMPDQVEPDGIPNEQNRPTSTLKSNVWYHKGLAHYLQGDFEKASQSYENALALNLTNDMKVAVIYWYYMSLKRSGSDLKAGNILEMIPPEIEIIENDSYLDLILVFKGVFEPSRLLTGADTSLDDATVGYGIGNWHYMNGREERALQIWQDIYENGYWPAFGYIASEAELARNRKHQEIK